MRFLPGKGLFLFIALRWMQPDRGMMWQAENSELAREFPAGTASKARQSRLHQEQGFFPVFVFHSFVQFLNNSCSNNQFMVNSCTIHEHSCFIKRSFRLSSFVLCLFLSLPLSSSLFLSFPLFLFSSPFLSFPLSPSPLKFI